MEWQNVILHNGLVKKGKMTSLIVIFATSVFYNYFPSLRRHINNSLNIRIKGSGNVTLISRLFVTISSIQISEVLLFALTTTEKGYVEPY